MLQCKRGLQEGCRRRFSPLLPIDSHLNASCKKSSNISVLLPSFLLPPSFLPSFLLPSFLPNYSHAALHSCLFQLFNSFSTTSPTSFTDSKPNCAFQGFSLSCTLKHAQPTQPLLSTYEVASHYVTYLATKCSELGPSSGVN